MAEYNKYEIADGFYCVDFANAVRSFLFLGDKEALLIDTCFGVGNFKAEVQSLTDLPLTVVYTHGDKDHVGAAKQFQKNRMHPCEFAYYADSIKDVVAMEPLWEGEQIDIGTYHFEVILPPGHTPGSIMLLEADKRFLIGGDSVQRRGEIFMFGAGRSFEAFRASMGKLLKRVDEFDIVYASHNQLEVPPDTVNLLYDAAGKMLSNSIEGEPAKHFDESVKRYAIGEVAFFAF
jgi:glyoxylase-like metal-dependent hydrolase (beta-lactamase superfamily II)